MGRQTVSALGTLVALAVAFIGYEQTLGRLTDFEPIDAALLKPLPPGGDVTGQLRPEYEIAAERAFGPVEAAKLARLKMYQVPKAAFSEAPPGRGLGLFIFFGEYKLRADDDPKLVDFQTVTIISISGKPTADAAQDDIYTLQADHAKIRFDRELEISKGNSAQPLAGWVEGNVKLRSNQGTANRDDDDVTVVTDRLDYEKARNLIWADHRVDLTTKEGMHVRGVGLEIELAPEKPKGTPGAGKRKASDVEKLRLLDDVFFHLLVDEENQVLGGLTSTAATATPQKQAAPKKVKTPVDVTAKTFNYDVRTMVAVFDHKVVVDHKNAPPATTCDHLICDKLRLQFAERPTEKPDGKKPGTVAAAAPPTGGSVQTAQQKTTIQSVEALRSDSEEIVVLAESQRLHATGDHLFHDAVKRATWLKSGKKIVVIQDNVRIEGRMLFVQQDAANGPNEKAGVREAIVDGPEGLLEVTDKEAKGPVRPKELVVRFNKSLHVTPDKKNPKSRMVDVDGGVELEVPTQPLLMNSELLHVRLDEAPALPAAAGKPAQASSKLEPTWLMAERSVTVSSPDLDVAAGQSLTMHVTTEDDGRRAFVPVKDEEAALKPIGFVALPDENGQVAATQVLKPADDAPKEPAEANPAAQIAGGNDPAARRSGGLASPARPGEKQAATKKSNGFDLGFGRSDKVRDPGQPPDKVDLRAETVEVFAVKVNGKTEARRAEAIGDVYIRRDAAKTPEDAVEIKGERADFYRTPKGDRMVVHGTPGGKRPAEIINKKFHLADCRLVDLDEAKNMMIVTGAGKLTLVGASLLNATDAPKNARASDKPFVVEWSKRMEFDGLNAQFDGDVVSSQRSQRIEPIEEVVEQSIKSRLMRVYFKDKLTFRGAKTEAGKKMEVKKVVCDGNVVALEAIFRPPPGRDQPIEEDRFRHSGISAPSIIFDNVLREVVASGPGSKARFIERAKPTVGKDGKPVQPELPYVRTDAEFSRLTYRQDEKVVRLFESVKAIRSPVEHVREALQLDDLRPEGMAILGEEVQLQERLDEEGRKQHDFRAITKVQIQTKEYQGFGDEATYDQLRDRFLLTGDPAMMQKVAKPGLESPTQSASEFEYYLKSNRVIVRGGQRAPNLDLGDLTKGKGMGVPVKGAKPKQKEERR